MPKQMILAPSQLTFAHLAHVSKKKVTRRERLLAEMGVVLPWTRLVALIAPHYANIDTKDGRPAIPLEVIKRLGHT